MTIRPFYAVILATVGIFATAGAIKNHVTYNNPTAVAERQVEVAKAEQFQREWEADQARLRAEQAERDRKWEEGKAQREKDAADREYEAIASLPLYERQSVCTNRSHPYYGTYKRACAKFYSQF